ncbi:MAG: hypothetical protein ACK4YP_28660, partial [Myxococcota bacterium]
GTMARTGEQVVDERMTLADAVARVLEGELRAIGEALDALPESHPRRRILLANYRRAVALLGDMPRLITR